MDEGASPTDLSRTEPSPRGQRTTRRQILRGLVGVGIVPLLGELLAACGATTTPPQQSAPAPAASPPAPAPSPAAPATAPSPGAQTAAPAGARAPGGRIVVAQGVDANTLDPPYANGIPEKNIIRHIFDSLVDRDPKTLKIVPLLATEWRNVDELTWEFKLADGIRFHNGEPFNAEAVKFTLDRLKGDPKNTTGFVSAASYADTEVVDNLTARIKTSKPCTIMPELLVDIFMLPPKYYTDTPADDLARRPVGSGPVIFKEWVKDDHVTVEASPNYWRTPTAIQQVVIKPIPELSTRVAQLQSGEADVIVNVAPDQAAVLETGSGTRIARVQGGRIIHIGMRTDTSPLDDKRVRQAFNYAVDFDTINKQILGGIGKRAIGPVNPPHVNADLKPYSYDPEKAKALLKEAGVSEGLTLVMDTTNGRYLKDKEIAQAVAQNLAAVGVNVEVKPLEWTVYISDMLFKQATDPLYFLGLGSNFSGQEELTYLRKGYIANSTYWENAEYLALYDQLTGTFDPAKRQEIMNRMQAIALDEAPWIPLWHQVDIYGVSKRLQWEPRADERINMYEATLS